ncbi:NAD-binding protein [Haladaptatus sp. F3-133]|uniref:NAD-binding protein n=1 Tax=Halorutilus salinus TaxID=2487751 RepID=A0A9Q4GH68_9EURY|nr:NAD-binding protein [Halorutilus salinus]MCX2818495.1 NAD-binding protein [Halorutilus salinus]
MGYGNRGAVETEKTYTKGTFLRRMKVVTVGIDTDSVDALRDEEHEVSSTDAFGADALREAGVEDADAVVIGGGYPTQVVVAKEMNPDARVLFVSDEVPGFVRGNADLILSDELADRVVEALETDENV